jgi:tetratricopeptide (TPR) repeat protein
VSEDGEPVEEAEGDAAADGDAAAAADEDTTTEEEELPDLGFPEEEVIEQPEPVYALAIGLFKVGLQTDENQGATINNYLIGKTYLDWLDNKDVTADQPLDRQQAREEAEENLARATDTYNYNPTVYAIRGLNLAWLDRADEAGEQLDKAQQYAPHQTGGVWDTIRKAWEVLGDEDKLQQIDDLIAAMRQEQLRQAIEQAQQGGEGGQPGQINFGDIDIQPQGADGETGEGAGDEASEAADADAGGDDTADSSGEDSGSAAGDSTDGAG